MSGLKINFTKSCLFGVGMEMEILELWASRIHCKGGNLQTIYLGLPLGVNLAFS